MPEQPKTKLAKDIQPGDKVETKKGQIVKITEVTPGWTHDSVLLNWQDGWACVNRNEELIVHD